MFHAARCEFGRALSIAERVELYGSALLRLKDTNFATITEVNGDATSKVMAYTVDRPAFQLVTAVAAAAITDGLQCQVATAGLKATGTEVLRGLAQGRQKMRMKGSFYMTDLVNADLMFAFNAIDTSMIASASNDYIGLRKLKADTGFKMVSRNNGNNEVALQFTGALGDATWIEYDFECYRTGTGTGYIRCAMGANPNPGDLLTSRFDYTFSGGTNDKIPDVNVMASSFAWRVGNTNNTASPGAIGAWGWSIDR